MLKVVTVVGTRPEIIKLSRIMSKLEDNFEHILIHTGQNYDYELSKIFFDELDIKKPDYYLNSAKKTASSTIGNILINFEKICLKIKPDAVVILGDTNSGLSSIVAKKLRIPIFHIEAGNRCFDQRVPEEINRKIIDHISDINLPYSDIAREYLINEGINPYQIIKIGSPMMEIINYYKKNINKSKILQELSLTKNKFFLLSFHREENVDDKSKLKKFLELVEYLDKNYNNKIIISTHFRTEKRIKALKLKFPRRIIIKKPFGFFDYLKLQISANIVFSDSGTITEEASILNLKAISLRSSHERPEGLEEGAVIFNNLDIKEIISSINFLRKKTNYKKNNKIVSDYNVSNVSDKIVKIIMSYLGYINENIWKK